MRKTFKRTVWTLGILLALIVLAWAVVRVSQTQVEPWPEQLADVRLEPARPILLSRDVTDGNAFYYIQQLTSAVPSEEIAPWPSTEWERFNACGWSDDASTGLLAWAGQAAPAFELARRATGGSECQVETITSFEQSMPYLNSVLRMARVGTALAEHSAVKGDWKDASSRYRTVLLLGDHVSRGGPLINHLVNYSAAAMTCRSLRRAALRHPPGCDPVEYMTALLEQVDRNVEPFAEAIKYEHLSAVSAIDLFMKDPAALASLGGGEVPRRRSWSLAKYPLLALTGSTRETMSKHFAAVYSHLVNIASSPHDDGRSFEDAVPGFKWDEGWLRSVGTFTDDGIGRILTALLVPALDNARDRAFAYHAELRATRVTLALAAWKQDHESFPETLAALVPAYLPEVPDDPFGRDGGPLRYATSNGNFVVYSVGPDGVDNGGFADWSTGWSMPGTGEDCVFGPGEATARCDAYMARQDKVESP